LALSSLTEKHSSALGKGKKPKAGRSSLKSAAPHQIHPDDSSEGVIFNSFLSRTLMQKKETISRLKAQWKGESRPV